jgi:hypothetical protein
MSKNNLVAYATMGTSSSSSSTNNNKGIESKKVTIPSHREIRSILNKLNNLEKRGKTPVNKKEVNKNEDKLIKLYMDLEKSNKKLSESNEQNHDIILKEIKKINKDIKKCRIEWEESKKNFKYLEERKLEDKINYRMMLPRSEDLIKMSYIKDIQEFNDFCSNSLPISFNVQEQKVDYRHYEKGYIDLWSLHDFSSFKNVKNIQEMCHIYDICSNPFSMYIDDKYDRCTDFDFTFEFPDDIGDNSDADNSDADNSDADNSDADDSDDSDSDKSDSDDSDKSDSDHSGSGSEDDPKYRPKSISRLKNNSDNFNSDSDDSSYGSDNDSAILDSNSSIIVKSKIINEDDDSQYNIIKYGDTIVIKYYDCTRSLISENIIDERVKYVPERIKRYQNRIQTGHRTWARSSCYFKFRINGPGIIQLSSSDTTIMDRKYDIFRIVISEYKDSLKFDVNFISLETDIESLV